MSDTLPDPPSVDAILGHIGITAWICLSFHCTWGKWPPSLSANEHLRLVGAHLIEMSDDQPFGTPNSAGRNVANLLRKNLDELVARYEAKDDKTLVELIRRTASGGPEPEDTEPWDQLAEESGMDKDTFTDPDQWAKTLRMLASDPAQLQRVTGEMGKMMAFLKKVLEAVEKFPDHLDRHYRGEIVAIGKDLVRDLGLGKVDDDEICQALMVFLQRGDDDDEPEPQPAPAPESGNLVPA